MDKHIVDLTAYQVMSVYEGAYEAFINGIHDLKKMPRELKEEYGTSDPDEIWKACHFKMGDEGTLLCLQSNDVGVWWNVQERAWDDIDDAVVEMFGLNDV